MKNSIITYCFLLVSFVVNAQSELPDISQLWVIGDSTSTLVKTDFSGSLNIPVSNSFIKPFYQGEYITKELKTDNLNRLHELSTFGADLNYGISATFRSKKSEKINFFGQVVNREHINGTFDKSLFGLVFFGNKPYAGDTILIKNNNLNLLRYQQLQFGILHKISEKHEFGIGISYLNGEENQQFRVNQFSLETDSLGKQIDADWDINYTQSNPNNKGYAKDNGYGFSTDIYYTFTFGNDTTPESKIQLSVTDLGFINWYSKSHRYHLSDSLAFDGFTVPEATSFFDSLNVDYSSFIENNSVFSEEKHTTILPFMVGAKFTQQHHPKFQISIRAYYRFFANYKARATVRETFTINEFVSVFAQASYGGYNKIVGGLGFSAKTKWVNINLSSTNLNGIIVPKKQGGAAIFCSLSKTF